MLRCFGLRLAEVHHEDVQQDEAGEQNHRHAQIERPGKDAERCLGNDIAADAAADMAFGGGHAHEGLQQEGAEEGRDDRDDEADGEVVGRDGRQEARNRAAERKAEHQNKQCFDEFHRGFTTLLLACASVE